MKGAGKASRMSGDELGAHSTPTGSPTQLEMGFIRQAAEQATEVPVPETPPNAGLAQQPGSLLSNGPGGFGFPGGFAPNVGVAPNLASGAQFFGNTAGFEGQFGGMTPCLGLGGQPMFAGAPSPLGNPFGVSQPSVLSQANCGSSFVPPSGICSGSRGPAPPGGLTPQASKLHQIATLVGELDANQTRELQLALHERLGNQSRMIPEYFGEVPRSQSPNGYFGDAGPVLPGVVESSYGQQAQLDVFSKTEKWLTPAPVPDFEKWPGREDEITGFADYVTQLSSWAAQASLEFSQEIVQSSRWSTSITWESLSSAQRSRATRLLSILRAAFLGHARTAMLINAFTEGVSLEGRLTLDPMTVRNQTANGYELLRQLTQEYSLQTRAEALALRTALATKTFSLKVGERSSSTQVADIIRRIDYEAAKYMRLLSTLPSSIDSTGLGIPEADLLLILLRNLPDTVRSYCLHHASGETYLAYRQAARNWEERQRLFGDGQFGFVKQVFDKGSEVQGSTGMFSNGSESEDGGNINAVSTNQKCQKCGSKKHSTSECSTDLSKVRCFRCNMHGHIGMNCPQSKKQGVDGNEKQKGKGKGKKGSSGKGYGKKGKLNEVSEENPEDWSWESQSWWQCEVWQDDGWHSSAWDGHEWDDSSWQDSSWYGSWSEHEASGSPGSVGSGEHGVGSLLISMLTGDSFLNDEETGLFLESQSFQEEEVSCFPQPFDDVLDSCFPQPFDVVVGTFSEPSDGEKPVNHGCPVFCSCPRCSEIGARFHEHVMLDSSRRSCDRLAEERGFQPSNVLGLSSRHLQDWRSGVESSADENCFEGLVSSLQTRVSRFKLRVSTFLSFPFETCSSWMYLRRFGNILWPLLSQLSMEDSSWWLLDSGASTTVLAQRFAHAYGCDEGSSDDLGNSQFRAANGSIVKMSGRAQVGVSVVMVDEWGENRTHRHAQLKALVGNIQHNIISTTSLCRNGWDFWQGDSWFELVNRNTGEKAVEVGYFAGCPWVKLHAQEGTASGHQKVGKGVGKQPPGNAKEEFVGNLAPLTKASQRELEVHRLQGHTPFDPRCLECVRGKSTFHHRRRQDGIAECELQADFAYLSSKGEMTDEEVDRCFKVLVLVEMSSNCTCFISVDQDLQSTRNSIAQWLEFIGMSSSKSSIVLHTDAERAVGQLVSRVSSNFTFTIRRASPQQHRSVGGAERGVRRLKENLAVLRADLNKGGVDIPFTKESLQLVLTYLSLVHNHFGKSPSADLSPLEFVSERKLSKPQTALYGMSVVAEAPSSLLKDSPNETRSIEAIYLHGGLGTGPVVQGKIRVGSEMVLKRFVARNVKPILPFSWNLELAGDLLMKVDDKHTLPDVSGERDGCWW